MLLNKSTSSLPNLYPETLYSFYPYPLTSRRTTHDTLKRSEDKSSLTPGPGPGPGPSSLLNQERRRRQRSQQAHELDRASKRALLGKRPAGIGGGRDAEDMSDEEKNLEEDKVGVLLLGSFRCPLSELCDLESFPCSSPNPNVGRYQQVRIQVSTALRTTIHAHGNRSRSCMLCFWF